MQSKFRKPHKSLLLCEKLLLEGYVLEFRF